MSVEESLAPLAAPVKHASAFWTPATWHLIAEKHRTGVKLRSIYDALVRDDAMPYKSFKAFCNSYANAQRKGHTK